jgi:hypothetical protein
MRAAFGLGFVLALLLPTSLAAKGMTTKITVTDVSLASSIDITDPSVLEQFNVWAGRGTFVTIPGQERREGTNGFIIDWLAGAVSPPPIELHRYEVKFFVRYPNSATEQLAYIVYYAHNPASGQGFVYLPGKSEEPYRLNLKAIRRGNDLEGNWFLASPAWQDVVGRMIVAR